MYNIYDKFLFLIDQASSKIIKLLARSASLRSAGCEHYVSALGPSALSWGKLSRILQFQAFVSFHTETTYQLITIEPRFYKNVIICLLFSRKQQQKLIICC